MSRSDRRRPRRPAPDRREPFPLRTLALDPEYLAIKERLGEVLSAEERARLDAARPAPAPTAIGGGS